MTIKKRGEGFRGEEGCIGYLLRQAQHALRLTIDRSLRKYGMTHPEFAVLHVLAMEPGLHAADIARMCMLSPQAVKTIVSNLEAAQLVTRTAHEIHGRVLEICLTDLGKKRLEQCNRVVYAIEEKLQAGLKPGEEKLIKKWLVGGATIQH